MALLEVEEIHTYYGAIEALRGISLRVEDGEAVTIIGSNGAGKSTTLRSISGLTPARSGTVTFEGQEITRLPAHEIVACGIALAPPGRAKTCARRRLLTAAPPGLKSKRCLLKIRFGSNQAAGPATLGSGT